MPNDNEKAFSINITIPTIIGIVVSVIFLTFLITFLITKKSNTKDNDLVILDPSLNIKDCATVELNGPISLKECKNYIGQTVSSINKDTIGNNLHLTLYTSPNTYKNCIDTSPKRVKGLDDIIAGITYIRGDPLDNTKPNQCWMYSDTNNKLKYDIMSPQKIPPKSPIRDKIWSLWNDPNNSHLGVHIDPASISIYDPSLINVNLTK